MKDFSEETGVPYRTLHDYAAGKRRPGADHLIRMSAVGLDINWLLTGAVRFAFEWMFPQEDDRGSVVAADNRILDLTMREAWRAADSYVERRRGRSLPEMTAYQTGLVFAYYWSVIIRFAAKVLHLIVEIRAFDDDEEQIREILLAPITSDLDYNIDAWIESRGQQARP